MEDPEEGVAVGAVDRAEAEVEVDWDSGLVQAAEAEVESDQSSAVVEAREVV